MIKVTIADLLKQEQDNEAFPESYIVALLSEDGHMILPIWISQGQLEVMAHTLLGKTANRPLTYTFMANILKATQVEVESVRIEKIENDTFYAITKLRSGDQVQEVDARPSDAINLALQTGSPIYVADEVMAQAGIDVSAISKKPAGRGLTEIGEAFEAKINEYQQRLEQRRAEKEQSRSEAQAQEEQRKRQEMVAFIFGETE